MSRSSYGSPVQVQLQPPLYQIDTVKETTGKHLPTSKRKSHWKFGFASVPALSAGLKGPECRGMEHDVDFIWSYATGKRLIAFDGKEIHRSVFRLGNDFHFTFEFQEFGLSHILEIGGKGTAFLGGFWDCKYELRLDGQSFKDMKKIYQLGHGVDQSSWARQLIKMDEDPLASSTERRSMPVRRRNPNPVPVTVPVPVPLPLPVPVPIQRASPPQRVIQTTAPPLPIPIPPPSAPSSEEEPWENLLDLVSDTFPSNPYQTTVNHTAPIRPTQPSPYNIPTAPQTTYSTPQNYAPTAPSPAPSRHVPRQDSTASVYPQFAPIKNVSSAPAPTFAEVMAMNESPPPVATPNKYNSPRQYHSPASIAASTYGPSYVPQQQPNYNHVQSQQQPQQAAQGNYFEQYMAQAPNYAVNPSNNGNATTNGHNYPINGNYSQPPPSNYYQQR